MYLCVCICAYVYAQIQTQMLACVYVFECVCAYMCSYFFLMLCACVVLILYIVGVCVHVRQSIHSLLPPPEIALQPIVGRAKLDMTYENGSLLLVVRHVRIVVMIYPLPLPLPPHVNVM